MDQKEKDELRAFVEGQTRIFVDEEQRRYESFKKFILWFLEEVKSRVAPMGMVAARTKEAASFAEKCIRKHDKFKDPVYEFADLCGGRLVVHTRQEVEDAAALIRECLDNVSSEDKLAMAAADQFGYGSVHLDISVGENLEAKLAAKGMTMPEEIETAVRDVMSPGRDGKQHVRKAEIQVRTDLQHVWADTLHDSLYKTNMDVPRALKREANRLSAVLEEAGSSIDSLVTRFSAYEVDHGAYMSEDEMLLESERLHMLLDQTLSEKSKSQIALRLAKLGRSMRDWKKVIDLKEMIDMAQGPVKDELRLAIAEAYCRAFEGDTASRNYQDGLKVLRELANPIVLDDTARIGRNKDEQLLLISQKLREISLRGQEKRIRIWALSELARSEFVSKKGLSYAAKARDLYYQAHLSTPGNPYVFGRFLLAHAIDSKDRVFSIYMHGSITQAMTVCREHAVVGIELPFAHFTEALFHALLGDIDACLLCCTRGIAASGDHRQIREELDLFSLFKEAVEDKEAAFAQKLKMVLDTFKLGIAVKEANDTKTPIALDSDMIALDKEIARPAVIIAGTCNPSQSAQMEPYRSFLEHAFERFSGTVYCGGTTGGISGIVGDAISEARKGGQNRIELKAHFPEIFNVKDCEPHGAYTTKTMEGTTDFTCLQAIQYWIDLLRDGVEPEHVRVLGVGGGSISLFEYHLAVALGATVGIIAGSGRSGAEIVGGESWWRKAKKGGCFTLPADKETVWNFLNVIPGDLGLDEATKLRFEPAARALHEKYVSNALTSSENRSLAPWDSLSDTFKISNFHQALHATRILEEYGLEIRERGTFQGDPISDLTAELGAKGIERLAEMEHGRWNVERLIQGWQYGPVKNIAEKINPCIVPWNELSDGEHGVKKYDREPFRELPKILERAGLGIYRV